MSYALVIDDCYALYAAKAIKFVFKVTFCCPDAETKDAQNFRGIRVLVKHVQV